MLLKNCIFLYFKGGLKMKKKISIFPAYLLTFILTFTGFFNGFEKKANAETKPTLKNFRQAVDEKGNIKQFGKKSSSELLKPQSMQNNAAANLPSIKLGFKPTDTVMDPNRPVIYMTDIENKRVYSVNYETGEIKFIQLDLKPETLAFANNEVYVSLLKTGHFYWTYDPLQGAIAIINAESFTKTDQFDINQDPYDIQADNQGYIYIASGCNQWSDLGVYSRQTKQPVSILGAFAAQSFIHLHPNTSKIYSITTASSPRDITAYTYSNGIHQTTYDSPYHGDYTMNTNMRISPDGKYIFNGSGNIFACSDKQSDDMKYVNKLSSTFTDVAFDLISNLIFSAQETKNINVYNYENFSYLSRLTTEGFVKNLYYKNKQLLAVSALDDNSFIIERINLDNNPLQSLGVVYTSPMNNENGLPVRGSLAIIFNKNIILKNPNCILVDSNNNQAPITHYSVKNNILFIYYDNLAYETNYTLTLNNDAVTDFNLNSINTSFNLSFATDPEYTRVYGANRYETSAKISQKYWQTSNYIVLATGENFPDALCASPLAARYSAPILLTPSKSLDPSIELEITRLKPKQVFIVGGAGAVSNEIKQKLESKGITVTRIYGASRYDTSLEIAKYLGPSKNVFVVTGNNYPDALSIASLAAYYEMPIMLADTNTLPYNSAVYILNSGVSKGYVVGGPGVLEDSVVHSLPNGERIAGTNRYETNAEVLRYFPCNTTTAFVATGENFADALSGSSPSGLMFNPIILANDNMSEDVVDFLNYNKKVFKMKVTLGGTGAVSDSIVNRIFK